MESGGRKHMRLLRYRSDDAIYTKIPGDVPRDGYQVRLATQEAFFSTTIDWFWTWTLVSKSSRRAGYKSTG